MLNLYAGTIGSCSLATHFVLEEAGADYEVTRLDYSKGQQRSPDYLKINPKGRVPALATDKGIITETPAVLFYIAQTHPKANLLPKDAFDIAKLQDFNNYLCSTVHPNHAHGIRGARWSDDPAVIEGLKAKVPQNMADGFQIIENDYFRGPWVMGEQFTIADPYLYVIARWLEGDKVDVKRFPKVNDHFNRMTERPAVKKVLATYA